MVSSLYVIFKAWEWVRLLRKRRADRERSTKGRILKSLNYLEITWRVIKDDREELSTDTGEKLSQERRLFPKRGSGQLCQILLIVLLRAVQGGEFGHMKMLGGVSVAY